MLLGVIVHSKVLGRSRHHHHHHHHRHKRAHTPLHHSSKKRSKLEVGIGDVTPPESPKKPPVVASPVVTSSTMTSSVMTSSVMTSSVVTSTMKSLPSMYKTGENEVTSTSITHFSAGIKDDDDATDVAYSPSDDIEKTMPETAITKNSVPVTTSEGFTAPSLSPNTMSKLQSLIQTVKDSIASLPAPSSEAMAKQNLPMSSASQAPMEENKNDTVTTSNDNATDNSNTSSAYVFHESLPVTSSVTMVTTLPVVQQQTPSARQHTSFYGNQDIYSSQTRAQLDHHQGDHRYQGDHYHGKREQWVPYRSNWSPQQR